MQRFDLIATPTLAVPAFDARPAGHTPMNPEAMLAWTPFSYPFNLSQQPACTIPCGLTTDGLPIGLQLVGPMFGDALGAARGARLRDGAADPAAAAAARDGMSTRPCLAFACAHLTDERLYAAQIAVLGDAFDCRVFVFRDEDSVRGMAEKVLAGTPPRFTLIGLSLGGYAAFEVVRLAPERLARLALFDTRASADSEAQRAGRHADIEKVRAGGIEALIPELPSRWLLPAHAARADLVALMADMAKSVGARGQRNQQRAMLARPDSHADLERLHLPGAGALRRAGSGHAGRRARGDGGVPGRLPARDRSAVRPPVDDRAARGGEPHPRRVAGGDRLTVRRPGAQLTRRP